MEDPIKISDLPRVKEIKIRRTNPPQVLYAQKSSLTYLNGLIFGGFQDTTTDACEISSTSFIREDDVLSINSVGICTDSPSFVTRITIRAVDE